MLVGFSFGVARAETYQKELPALTVGTVGVETGLPPDIFGKNPKAEDVIRQIESCADIDFNEDERDILRRVLMTDVGGIETLENQSESYLKARLNTLIKQGMFREALLLTDKIPQKTDELKRLEAEALFAEGFVAAACDEKLLNAFGPEEGFMRAICADSIGVPPASALAYEVYRESGRDHHPFLNAAGEVLYRNLSPQIPAGTISVWEAPITAKAYGIGLLERPLSREVLAALRGNETVPHEVRLKAESLLNERNKEEAADGNVLDHLRKMAQARVKLQKFLPEKTEKKRVESN